MALKPYGTLVRCYNSFSPIQNYMALKQQFLSAYYIACFSPIQNYMTLKHCYWL